jgi:hypothetical protein
VTVTHLVAALGLPVHRDAHPPLGPGARRPQRALHLPPVHGGRHQLPTGAQASENNVAGNSRHRWTGRSTQSAPPLGKNGTDLSDGLVDPVPQKLAVLGAEPQPARELQCPVLQLRAWQSRSSGGSCETSQGSDRLLRGMGGRIPRPLAGPSPTSGARRSDDPPPPAPGGVSPWP